MEIAQIIIIIFAILYLGEVSLNWELKKIIKKLEEVINDR